MKRDRSEYQRRWRRKHPDYHRQWERKRRGKNPQEITELERRYQERKQHPEKIKERWRRLRKEYNRKYMRIRWKYIGVCICPKCGEKGYKKYAHSENIKTGKSSSNFYTVIYHQHTEGGKSIHDHICYIGKGRL